MAELQPIIVFYSGHFVRHLGICNRICVNLLQHMSGVITHNSVKKNKVSLLINGWVTAKYSFSRPQFVCHLGICNPILQVMYGVIPSNLKQKRRLYLKPFSWGPQTWHTFGDFGHLISKILIIFYLICFI